MILVAATASCATASKAVNEDPFTSAARGEQIIRIEVLNSNFSDATLWAIVQDSRRIRLGRVTGKSDSVFTLPWKFSYPLRLDIDLLAGPRCVTRAIETDPGDVLQLEIRSTFQETPYCERF